MTIFGLAMVVFFFGGIQRATAVRWRYLAENYAAQAGPPIESRNMRSVVLLGLGSFNSLTGIVTIGVHAEGVSFRTMKLFSLFQEPLFIPYRDIRGWGTTWYLDARSSELEFIRAPKIKMIVPAEEAEWIGKYAGKKMLLSQDSPPQGRAGRGWHAFAVANAVLSLFMLGSLLVLFLLRY